MLQKEEILQKLKDIKPILEKNYNLVTIGLFGSYVRNEAIEESEIDLLVGFKESLGWELIDVKNDLKELLGKDVNIITENGLKPEYKDSILKEVVYV